MSDLRPQRRFDHFAINPDRANGLAGDHPALAEARTIFPSTVVSAGAAPRVLVKGSTQRKLGDRVVKGAWKNMPIYALTLEERATCPASCHHWATCYGNGMPMSRRHAHGDALVYWLDRELEQLNREHPRGFVVRLHVLGDFFSLEYVVRWAGWLDRFPALRAFGYSARPRDSAIGAALAALSSQRWDRFAIRQSVPVAAAHELAQAATIPAINTAGHIGIICPAQTEKTDCCGTCGLCWAPAAREQRILFMAHGGVGVARGVVRRPRARNGHASERQAALLAIASEAAARGAEMPTNSTIAKRLGYASIGHASMDLTALETKGLVRVERFSRGRIVTIVETGERTATPANTNPHWRTLRAA